jgi:hypothetical protein
MDTNKKEVKTASEVVAQKEFIFTEQEIAQMLNSLSKGPWNVVSETIDIIRMKLAAQGLNVTMKK